jgi:hypothetical protein
MDLLVVSAAIDSCPQIYVLYITYGICTTLQFSMYISRLFGTDCDQDRIT